jgi:three-Cys-motif partner protein
MTDYHSTKSALGRKKSTSVFVSTSIFPAQLGENGFKARVVRLISIFFAERVRAVIRDTREKIDGSPLVAFKCALQGGVPFSEIHIADASEESCRAAERRIASAGGLAKTEFGNAEDTVVRIAKKLNPYGLHLAFLDPYNLEALPFLVIEAFAKFKYIDILIHVSAQDLQRNLHSYTRSDDTRLERFAPGWRIAVDIKQSKKAIRAALLGHWASKMEALGLPPRSMPNWCQEQRKINSFIG